MKSMTWAWAVASLLGAGLAQAADEKPRGATLSTAQDTKGSKPAAGAGSDVGDTKHEGVPSATQEKPKQQFQVDEKSAYINIKKSDLGLWQKDISDLRQKVQSMGGDHASLLRDLDDLQARRDRIAVRLEQLRESKATDWKADREQINQTVSDFYADMQTLKQRVAGMSKSTN